MFGSVFDRLTLEHNARLGMALAIGSAAGWGLLLGGVVLPHASEIATHSVTLGSAENVIACVSVLPIALGGYYGRSIALRDLASRVDVKAGVGKKWRWGLAVQFWGAWAYWFFGARRLPAQGTYLEQQERLARFGPLRPARQRDPERSGRAAD